MIKPHIDDMKPFFFEFRVFEASFKRKLRLHKFENEVENSATNFYDKVGYYKLKKLNDI